MAIDRRETGRRVTGETRGGGDKEEGKMRNKEYFPSSPCPTFSLSPLLPFSVSVAEFFFQNFRSGLDISIDSVEDLRLNKSEISQASVSFFK
jgi:hypothetical protein